VLLLWSLSIINDKNIVKPVHVFQFKVVTIASKSCALNLYHFSLHLILKFWV